MQKGVESMDLELKGKIAAVTGGSEGTGFHTALRLGLEGALVSVCARRGAVLERAAEKLRAESGAQVLAVQADVSQPDDCRRFIDESARHFDGLDILVNNAGRGAAAPFESVDEDGWTADLDLKVHAAIRCARAAIPYLRARGGGRIVNITTPGGKYSQGSSLPTSLSRAAGIALTKAMSKDLAPDGILVNTVCLSNIKTAQGERVWRASGSSLSLEEYFEAQGKQISLDRMGEPGEVADLVAFLVSARAAFITGTAINIDGGDSPVV